MLQKKTTFTFFIFAFLFGCIQTIQAQMDIKKGVKFGVEFSDYLSTQTGGFSKEPGISFGYFTGINLYSNSENAVQLGLEFNFTRVIRYRINYTYIAAYEYRINHFLFDQKFRYSFIEIVLTPEYHYVISEDMMFDFFIGPSVGIGTQYLQTNEIGRVKLDTLNYSGEFYYPFGEYNMDRFKTPACLNLGMRFYYSSFVVDIRYRYTYVNSVTEVNNFKNVYAQVGLTF
jgi:hypothetical protein